MNTKKTWFSYILWLIATGFSVVFIYINVKNVLEYLGVKSANSFSGVVVYGTCFVGLVVWISLKIMNIQEMISVSALSNKILAVIHPVIFAGLTAIFYLTRVRLVGQYSFESEAIWNLYEMTKVGSSINQIEVSLSVFERLYTRVVSALFLFLGNKIEVILYFQFFLQAISFLLLAIIGFRLQKGILAWIPVLFYTCFPLFEESVTDVGIINFRFGISLGILVFICLLEGTWKRQLITYIAIAVFGIAHGVLLFGNAVSYFVSENAGYLWNMNEVAMGYGSGMFCGELLLGVLLLFCCISSRNHEMGYASLCLIPAMVSGILIIAIGSQQIGLQLFLHMLMNLFLFFVITEGIGMFWGKKQKSHEVSHSDPFYEEQHQLKKSFEPLAEKKTEISVEIMEDRNSVNEFEPLSNANKPNISKPLEKSLSDAKDEATKSTGFNWWDKNGDVDTNANTSSVDTSVTEQDSSASKVIFFEDLDIGEQETPEQGEPALVKVSDIMKQAVSNNPELEKQLGVENVENQQIDKTAMIENVLPMPKKHVSRSLEYAFEPSDDMMHFDVEIENDDYDYE